MARTEADIKDDIRIETAACVERTKSSQPFGGFFFPRKKAEPDCEQKARNKYSAELAEAQAASATTAASIDDALLQQLSGGSTQLYGIIGLIVVVLIIVAIILA